MTLQDNVPTQAPTSVSFVKPVLIGAGIALLVILFFVLGADSPDPAWGAYWMIRPLILTPLAGAVGGAFYAFMMYQRARGFSASLAVLIGVVGVFIAIWMGVVVGLDGTMWD